MPALDIQKLAKEKQLPACPAVLTQLMEATQRPNVTVKDMAAILSADQALTIKVLRLVNSAFFGLPRSVHSVEEASFRLGFRELWALAMAIKVDDLYRSAEAFWNSETDSLWHHSLKTGIIARGLAERTRVGQGEEAFTAGVIHDIGKMILCSVAGERFAELTDGGKIVGRKLCKIESEEWEMDHAKIGAELARLWNLPESLAIAIEKHHEPYENDEVDAPAGLLSAADAVAHVTVKAKYIGEEGEEAPENFGLTKDDFETPMLPMEVMQKLNIQTEDCLIVAVKSLNNFEEMIAAFSNA